MGFRQDLEKRIKKKEQEIFELKRQIDKAEAYLQALNDSLRFLPKDENEINPGSRLRPNSDLAKARNDLKKAGRALHITELLAAMGKPVTKSSRVSLSGSLSAYARRGEIFTRPLPNTFGLKEFEAVNAEEETRDVKALSLDDEDALSHSDAAF
jgi:hypothetical protein